MAGHRPDGTVAFLFTDIEGSTRAWEADTNAMAGAVARHDALLSTLFARHGGYVFKTLGDAFCVAFDTAGDAVAAAAAAQRALADAPWDGTAICVRIAIHVGHAFERGGDYFGPTLNRTARLMAAGHGGQTLLSLAAYELAQDELPADTRLTDLGAHRLRDLIRPEQIFQLSQQGLPSTFPPLRSLDRTPHNLPLQATSLIGRAEELAVIAGWLGRARLVTLIGPAGAGKTRLALQAAADSLDAFLDGAWFVDLSAVADPAHVDGAAARALGVREEAGRPVRRTLLDFASERALLIVLDNCEHVVAAAADLAAALVTGGGATRVIATSREALRVPGEQLYAVPPLRLPERRPATANVAAALGAFESVRLFVERATAVVPAFAVTNANAPAVAEICVRLDGIPLAIELAAVRVRLLSPEQILKRLGDRFRLLTGGSRTAQARQQTLEGAIQWSYDLLADGERAALRRLAVFRGGWTLEAAEGVIGDDPLSPADVLDVLASLVDKSLVAVDDAERATRYRLLESVRDFARLRLDASGEHEAVRRRRDRYAVEVVETAETHIPGPAMAQWQTRLEAEFDNLAAALEHAVTGGDAETALRLVAAQWWSWYSRGNLSEGRAWLGTALATPGIDGWPALVARAHVGLGVLANHQSDYADARRHFDTSLSLYEAIGDVTSAANVHGNLGITAWGQRDYDTAETELAAYVANWRALGEAVKVAKGLNNLAMVAASRNDLVRAREMYTEALEIHRAGDDPWLTAHLLGNLGGVVRRLGDLPEARRLLAEALSIMRELHDRTSTAFIVRVQAEVALDAADPIEAEARYAETLELACEIHDRGEQLHVVEGLARVAALRSDARRTLLLLSACAALRIALDIPHAPHDEAALVALAELSAAALPPDVAAAAAREGAAMSLEDVVVAARAILAAACRSAGPRRGWRGA